MEVIVPTENSFLKISPIKKTQVLSIVSFLGLIALSQITFAWLLLIINTKYLQREPILVLDYSPLLGLPGVIHVFPYLHYAATAVFAATFLGSAYFWFQPVRMLTRAALLTATWWMSYLIIALLYPFTWNLPALVLPNWVAVYPIVYGKQAYDFKDDFTLANYHALKMGDSRQKIIAMFGTPDYIWRDSKQVLFGQADYDRDGWRVYLSFDAKGKLLRKQLTPHLGD